MKWKTKERIVLQRIWIILMRIQIDQFKMMQIQLLDLHSAFDVKNPSYFLMNQKQNTDPDCKNRSATLFFIHKTIYSTCPTKKSFSGYSMGSVERRERGAKPRMSPHRFTSSPSRDILATTPWGQWNSVTRFFSTIFQGLIVAVADSIYVLSVAKNRQTFWHRKKWDR